MKNIYSEINKFKTKDIYSLMLYILYKVSDDPQYSTLSQLSYILNKEDLLKLCSYYGGLTIKIPSIDELELMLNALFVFYEVDIQKQDMTKTLNNFQTTISERYKIKKAYSAIKNTLKDIDFSKII